VRRLTTHTPQFLGLPTGVWPTGGGFDRAGEDIIIGFVDSGIFPRHPSFGSHNADPYGPLPKYRGKCEVDPDTKREFCNGKIIGAQHFAEAAIAAGAFNPSIDFASPMDGDGHGRLEPMPSIYAISIQKLWYHLILIFFFIRLGILICYYCLHDKVNLMVSQNKI